MELLKGILGDRKQTADAPVAFFAAPLRSEF